MKTKQTKKKKKEFDCVEMMHRAAQAVKSVTDPMTFDEKVAYWRQQSREFRKEVEAARRKAGRKTADQRG